MQQLINQKRRELSLLSRKYNRERQYLQSLSDKNILKIKSQKSQKERKCNSKFENITTESTSTFETVEDETDMAIPMAIDTSFSTSNLTVKSEEKSIQKIVRKLSKRANIRYNKVSFDFNK